MVAGQHGNIAIIPARAGSKRIPLKNIMEFRGKPMIAWTIKSALDSGLFEKVIVSTESEEIARIAKEYGAEVPFLRTNYFDDKSTVLDVTLDELSRLTEKYSQHYENVALLMANCPIRDSNDIKNAFNFFDTHDTQFVISCFKFGWMNPWWAVKLKNHQPTALFDGAINTKSQDLEELYCPSGAIRIANIKSLFEQRNYYGEGHLFFELDWKHAVDIDNMMDFEFAEAIHSLLR